MSFGIPWLLLLLPLPAIGLAVWIWAMRRGTARAARLSRTPPARPPYLLATLATVAIMLGVIAAAQPRWGTEPIELERQGADIMFVLDVSRGMAARDVEPSRFAALRDAVDVTLQNMDGDRVGLVIFGGSASLRFPLTSDTQAARAVLGTLEPGPIFVEPGTDIAAGLDLAREALVAATNDERGQLIVLLTDGEQLGAADPIAAAASVGAAGIDLLVVGAGTPEGAPVPVFDRREEETIELAGPDGNPVITRLDEAALVDIARAAGGRYLGADPAALPGAVQGRITSLERALVEARDTEAPVERFQWFAGAAFALVLIGWLSERASLALRRLRPASALGMALVAMLLMAACAEEGYRLNRQGIEAFERGEYARAVERFREAERAAPHDFQVSLNHAAALHEAGDYARAASAARRALESSRPEIRAAAHSSIGHSAFAADDLEAAYSAFRSALREFPTAEYRHNYEVVLRLLEEESDEPLPGEPNGDEPPPGNGDDEPSEPDGEENGEPGPGEPGEPVPNGDETVPGQAPDGPAETLDEVDEEISGIDQAIQELQPPDGEELNPDQARELLELLAERARLAALREALAGSAPDPTDY